MNDAWTPSLDPAWYDVIARRVSRRRFDGTPIPAEAAASLSSLCDSFRPFPDARAVFVADAPDGLFTGLVGSYGAVRGARRRGAVRRSARAARSAPATWARRSSWRRSAWGWAPAGWRGRSTRSSRRRWPSSSRANGSWPVTPVGRPIETPDTVERLMRGFVALEPADGAGRDSPRSRDRVVAGLGDARGRGRQTGAVRRQPSAVALPPAGRRPRTLPGARRATGRLGWTWASRCSMRSSGRGRRGSRGRGSARGSRRREVRARRGIRTRRPPRSRRVSPIGPRPTLRWPTSPGSPPRRARRRGRTPPG